jgi:eukaryotic-like serine/threonine-protein kinase
MASSTAEALSFDRATPAPGLPEPGTVVSDRYEIRELLGEGGMSAVFVAHDRRLRRKVAFKLLSPRLAHSSDIVTRFINEARTLARLDCANVVQVFDAGLTGEPGGASLPYMVLELMNGEELRAVADRGGYSDERAVGWVLDACEGLAAAHGEGIVHRDLKPENLFVVAEPDGGERVKLLDFGIARSLDVDLSLTLAGEGVGSPGYMSPEQLRDASSVDQRTDIWSLGVVLYELLARQPPFRSDSAAELCALILREKIPPLGELRPDLNPDLCAAVDRCLERDAERRFESVAELAEALQPFAPQAGVPATTRIRWRLHGFEPAEIGAADGDDSDDERSTPLVSSGVRRKKLVRRQWLARSLGLVLLLGVLALFALAFVPGAKERAHALGAETGQRIDRTARQLLSRP